MKNKNIFNISSTRSLQTKIYDEIFLEYLELFIAPDIFNQLVISVENTLPDDISPDVIRKSMEYIAGSDFTSEKALKLSWRLAGNIKRLKLGVPVYCWFNQPVEEKVGLLIENVVPKTLYKKINNTKVIKDGALMTFRIICGTSSGECVTRFWSSSLVKHFKVNFGFQRFANNIYKSNKIKVTGPYEDIRELFGFYFCALMNSESCKKGYPDFLDSSIECTASMVEFNRALILKRKKSGFKCPYNLPINCYKCPFGKLTCSASCHDKDFILKHCKRCGVDNWFNEDVSVDFCVDCFKKFNP